MTPYWPGMTSRVFAVYVLNADFVKFAHHHFAVCMCDIFLTSHRDPECFEPFVNHTCILFHIVILRVRQSWIIGKPTGAEYAEVCKLVNIFKPAYKVCKPPRDRPASALSDAFVFTLKVFSTNGIAPFLIHFQTLSIDFRQIRLYRPDHPYCHPAWQPALVWL